MYILYYLLLYPFLFLGSFFRAKSSKILIIQTAKIGDYANSSCVFDLACKFDIVLDKVNLSFANFDERIGEKFIINDYKKGFKKLLLGLKLYKNNYAHIYVLMPNNLNLFLANLAFGEQITTISHYKNSSFFKFLARNARKIHHSKEDLTLLSYHKMFGYDEIRSSKKLQSPTFVPANSLISSTKFKVGISLSAGNKIKTPPPQTWGKIFQILSKFDLEVYVFGLKSEENLLSNLDTKGLKIINLLGKLELKELPFYTSLMSLYISSDTGNYYIADSMKVPTICLMGPCYASEQRGVYRPLIICQNLEPFTCVFDTITDRNCPEFYDITKDDERKMLNFITQIYNDKTS